MVILMALRFDGDHMRFLPFLVLALLPGLALAQVTLPPVQKTPQILLTGPPPTSELGLPADPALPKTGTLVASRATDSAMANFDTDKIAGNTPAAAPLAQRDKGPRLLPDPAPAASGLGSGVAGEKVAVIEAAKGADSRTSTYDTDKIDGNPETFPPLLPREKAPGIAPEGGAAADLGQPATAPLPKVATLMASHADGRPTINDEDKISGNEPPPAPLTERQKAASYPETAVAEADLGLPAIPPSPKTADVEALHTDAVPATYDDDKIAGNAETYTEGPLAERQKYPSELAAGTDPATFGLPADTSPKEGDLVVSKAEIGVTNELDNDKIAGNPYVAPAMLPRQKLPSVLPDPVADADMGQPAAGAPKAELTVSKAAENVTTVEDNDKIVGNAVLAPPMPPRAKLPASEPALEGLSAEALGQITPPAGEKTAVTDISKAAEGTLTEYDDDKIAGNSYTDPALDDDGADIYAPPAPPPELTDQVRTLLDDPTTRTGVMSGLATRAPAAVTGAFQAFVGQLFDAPQVRDLMAEDIARVYMDMGVTPDNPAVLGRVAAEFMAGFGAEETFLGMMRLPVADQRAYLGAALRVADALPVAQCGPFLSGAMDMAQMRGLMLMAMVDWPEADRNSALTRQAAAILAQVHDTPPATAMTDPDAQKVRETLGAAAFAAIDAMEDADDLLAAFGDPFNASAEDSCAVQKLVINAALANTGADADLGVRYLVEYGWQN